LENQDHLSFWVGGLFLCTFLRIKNTWIQQSLLPHCWIMSDGGVTVVRSKLWIFTAVIKATRKIWMTLWVLQISEVIWYGFYVRGEN